MKLSFKTKLSYGVGAICDNAMYMLAGTYLLLFLTTVAGIILALLMLLPKLSLLGDELSSLFGL